MPIFRDRVVPINGTAYVIETCVGTTAVVLSTQGTQYRLRTYIRTSKRSLYLNTTWYCCVVGNSWMNTEHTPTLRKRWLHRPQRATTMHYALINTRYIIKNDHRNINVNRQTACTLSMHFERALLPLALPQPDGSPNQSEDKRGKWTRTGSTYKYTDRVSAVYSLNCEEHKHRLLCLLHLQLTTYY